MAIAPFKFACFALPIETGTNETSLRIQKSDDEGIGDRLYQGGIYLVLFMGK